MTEIFEEVAVVSERVLLVLEGVLVVIQEVDGYFSEFKLPLSRFYGARAKFMGGSLLGYIQ